MERIEAGSKLLAKDQRSAYAEAEEFFQQALLLEPRSDAAIAGYVQAVALGRGTSIDKGTFDEALSLIEAAEERSGRTALMLLAHANLLLCRPNEAPLVEQARQLAEEALGKGTDLDKAEAHLVLGRAYLKTSMGLANQHFDEALVLSPNLQRVQYHRALASEAAGAYALALEALKSRLEKDPEHWDSLVTMARIYLEVGEVEQARKLYEARAKAQPNDVRVLLALAVLRYQVEGNAAGAAKELRAHAQEPAAVLRARCRRGAGPPRGRRAHGRQRGRGRQGGRGGRGAREGSAGGAPAAVPRGACARGCGEGGDAPAGHPGQARGQRAGEGARGAAAAGREEARRGAGALP